jgi:SPP1 gp7 family putative phage head morphogenesis protein
MARSITDIATRHQVMLERLKAGKAKDYRRIAKKFEADLLAAANRLGVDSLDQLTKKELNLLIRNATNLNKKYQAAIIKDLEKDLKKLAKDDAIFERETINSFLVTGNAASATNLAYAAALTSPISATGELLEPFIKNWSRTRVNQVSGAIRKGYKEGSTLSQMTQIIRGTRANNFKDGLTSLQTRQAQAVIRTSVQHVSATARMQTWEANKDIVKAYKWRSTLDGRTTQRCRSLDGLEFEVGKGGPMPPIHINCRSTFNFVLDESLGLGDLDKGATRSALGGEVPAKQTYYDWLKNQPKDFQRAAIGKQKTTWLNDGKLNSEQFAKLNLDKNFKPLSLDQMREKRAMMLK